MDEATGKFSFLNRHDMIKFLRVTFRELRKLTLREGFSGVRAALDKALIELKKVEASPPEKRP
jgi:hypothetical protein